MPPSDNQPAQQTPTEPSKQEPASSGWQPAESSFTPGSRPKGDKKSLMIALIAAVIILVAAAVVGVWFMAQKKETPAANTTTSQTPAETPRKTSMVPPATMPEKYAKREQNIQGVQATYYYDSATACGITTAVMELNDKNGKTAKEAIDNSTKAAEQVGLKTTKNTAGPKYTLKDAGGKQDYAFESIQLEQDVNVQGAEFKKQKNTVAYRQFGNEVASVGMSCKNETWDSKKAELETLLKGFTVKTQG